MRDWVWQIPDNDGRPEIGMKRLVGQRAIWMLVLVNCTPLLELRSEVFARWDTELIVVALS